MPVYRVALMVVNKASARDPEGETIAHMLQSMGYSFVRSVRAGKVFIVEVEAGSPSEALEAARRLAAETRLYNPTVHELLVAGLA